MEKVPESLSRRLLVEQQREERSGLGRRLAEGADPLALSAVDEIIERFHRLEEATGPREREVRLVPREILEAARDLS